VTSRLRGLWGVALAPLVFVGGVGCQDSCGNVNCGSGVQVHWRAATLPPAARYRLCINDRCEAVRPDRLSPTVDTGGGDLRVAPHAATADRDTRVRLELFNGSNRRIATVKGRGRKSWHCCPGVSFRVTRERRLVVDET